MFATLLLLAGCQMPPPPALQPLPSSTASEEGAASPRTNGAVAVRQVAPTVPEVSEGTPAQVRSPGFPASDSVGGEVTLDFADTDIRAVVQQILGQVLKVDYTIDPAVHGTVTFKSARPLAYAAVLPTLEALLAQNGAILVRSANLYRVVPAAVGQSSPALGGAASAGTEIVPLRYTSAVDLVKVLVPVVGQGNAGQGNGTPGAGGQSAARIVADPAHNAILVTGDSSSRATIQSLIKSFDIDALAGRSYALFPVPSGEEPRRVAEQLREVFQTEGDAGLAGVVRIIPMDAADAVLVVASEPRFIEDARRLFRLLDKTRETTARSWHVYYVQNGESADLANVLQQAFTPNNVTEHGGSGSKGVGAIAPGQSLAQMNSGSSSTGSSSSTSSTGTGGGLTGSGSSSGQTASGSATAGGSGGTTGGTGASAATQSLSAGGEGGSGGGSGTRDQIRIIANHVNNAILIYATPEEQSSIEAMLRRIDILPLQVRIDASIAEVTLTDDLQYGTQFYLKQGGVNGLLSTSSSATSTNLSGNFPGFALTAGKVGSAELVLSALSDVTKVRVLSSPQIMVLDNQSARLLVGNLVPYQKETSQSTLTSSSSIVSSIDYRETGVILEVVPRVNKGGLVTLDLSQEVSAVQSTSSGNIDSPTFTDRSVRSRVVVQDGQTVGLAGMISDSDSQENSGIPFLKDIPGLGSLFSTQTNKRTRIELLVLITPHVIEDQRAARALTEEMRRSLFDAALAPQQLDVKPPFGSPNPNAQLLE